MKFKTAVLVESDAVIANGDDSVGMREKTTKALNAKIKLVLLDLN